MKRTFILSTVTVLTAALVLTSCKPSRVWATKEKEPEPYRNSGPAPAVSRSNSYYGSVGLIISPTPGFRMSQFTDGRYYHRSAQGFMYWKGYDNRFYLDKSYLNRVSYAKWEYKEWKRYSKQSNKR